jgi:hypothetical protein
MPYTPSTQNIPPYDGSGGKLLFSIQNSTIGVSYRVGVHIQSFSATRPGSPYNWPYAGGFTSQFVTDGGTWGGTETGVRDTAEALMALLAPMYGSQWTIALKRLYRFNPGQGRMVRVTPKPTITPVIGTYATNPTGATDRRLIVASIYSAPAEIAPEDAHIGVGRFRLKLPAAKLRDAEKHVEDVNSGTAPAGLITADDINLIAYLSGADTRIIAHNGGRADDDFTIFVGQDDAQRGALGFR